MYNYFENEMIHDFGIVHKGVCYAMKVTDDCRYIFTSAFSKTEGTQIKQFCITTKQLSNDYRTKIQGLYSLGRSDVQERIKERPILSMSVDNNSNILYAVDIRGVLFRIFIDTSNVDREIIESSSSITNKCSILAMNITKDGRFLFIANSNLIIQIDQKNPLNIIEPHKTSKVLHDYTCLVSSDDCKFLYAITCYGTIIKY